MTIFFSLWALSIAVLRDFKSLSNFWFALMQSERKSAISFWIFSNSGIKAFFTFSISASVRPIFLRSEFTVSTQTLRLLKTQRHCLLMLDYKEQLSLSF